MCNNISQWLTTWFILQSMTLEVCSVGNKTALPPVLQQQYNQLPSPQCTNLTYINTFYHKMILLELDDANISEILCNLKDAVSYLDLIHVSAIKIMFSYKLHNRLIERTDWIVMPQIYLSSIFTNIQLHRSISLSSSSQQVLHSSFFKPWYSFTDD